ncbi:uncharacterized protein LOC144624908 [Crassostrea virginica]
MEYIKVLVFITCISCSVNNVSMQGYVRLAEVPSFQIHCKETPVSSLLQCAALARASKDVRFFFNLKESYCRWSCTFLYTGSTLMTDQWQQYAIKLLRNAALSKTASVSSVQHNDHSIWGPQYATDGLKQYDFLNSFHSAFEQTPWFMITLDMPLTIQYVRVFNRRDGDGERFHDVAFEVSIDGSLFKQIGFFKGPGMTDQVIEILFDYPTIGKYLRIKITQGTNNALNIVEFEIYTLE